MCKSSQPSAWALALRPALLAQLILVIAALTSASSRASDWRFTTVDSTAQGAGRSASIALTSTGTPVIAYADSEATCLRLATYTGASWSLQTVDTTPLYLVSLAIDPSNGIHILYEVDAGLKYANWNGSTWSFSLVDSASTYPHGSIAVTTSGYPCVSYWNYRTHETRYAQWNGTSWQITTLASALYPGGTSIALDSNGDPHVVDGGSRRYFSRVNGSWVSDSLTEYPNAPSLVIDQNGNPIFAFMGPSDSVSYVLTVASRTNGTWTYTPIDSTHNVSVLPRLGLSSSGVPHISYWESYDIGNYNYQSLRYATQLNGQWMTEAVDTMTTSGDTFWSSIAVSSGGAPVIAYYESVERYLRYAYLASPAAVTTLSATPYHTTSPIQWTEPAHAHTLLATYDVRRATSPITSLTTFYSSTQVATEGAAPSGNTDCVTATGLTPCQKYYYAVVVSDAAGSGGLSNVPSATERCSGSDVYCSSGASAEPADPQTRSMTAPSLVSVRSSESRVGVVFAPGDVGRDFRLELYDVAGRRESVLARGVVAQSEVGTGMEVALTGRGVSAGVHFLRLMVSGVAINRTIVLTP